MEYEGKLYGKVGNGYFPLQETTMYVKQLENTVEFYRKECQNLRDYLTENKIGNPNQGLFDAILEHIKKVESHNTSTIAEEKVSEGEAVKGNRKIKIAEKESIDICPRCGKEFCNVIGAASCYECTHLTTSQQK